MTIAERQSLLQFDPADGLLHFRPHPDQDAVWHSTARYLALIAGTGGGKTSFAVPWLVNELKKAGPQSVGLFVEPTYKMSQDIAVPALTQLLMRDSKEAEYRKSDRAFELRTGQRINLASADNPDSMEGQHVHAVVLDEAGQMARLAWEVAQRRVGFHEGRVLITTTPYSINWLKDVVDRYEAGDPYYFVRRFASTANPGFSQDEFERARRELSPSQFAMKYLGKFERPEGLIYPDWDASMLVDPFPIPAEWTRYGGLDWGWNNPTAAVIGAVSPDDVLYLYAEYYQPERTIQAHAEALSGLGDVIWYSDPSAKAEAEQARRYGLHTRAADNDVLAGISEVTARIRTGRLRVFRGLTNWLDEIAAYRWATKPGTEEATDKPVKDNDHVLDATRYMVMSLRKRRRLTGGEGSF